MYNEKLITTEGKSELYGTYEGGEHLKLRNVDSSEFTDYFVENYMQLLHRVQTLGNVDPSLANDLMHDVWLSLNTRVLGHEDFNDEYINRKGAVLPVDAVVWNIISQYAKNSRYCKKYNNKVQVKRGETVDVISISPALCDEEAEGCSGTELSYRLLNEASLVKSNDIEGDICEELTKEESLRRAFEYTLVNTEDYSVSFATLMDNLDLIMEQINADKSTGKKVLERTGVVSMLHGTLFKEYTADKDLEYYFRVVFNAIKEDRTETLRVYREVKANLA